MLDAEYETLENSDVLLRDIDDYHFRVSNSDIEMKYFGSDFPSEEYKDVRMGHTEGDIEPTVCQHQPSDH